VISELIVKETIELCGNAQSGQVPKGVYTK